MNIARYIDHTLLKPEATPAQITKLCEEAVQYGFASVCINSSYVSLAKQLLAGTPVKVCAVIGFPFGAMSTEAKLFELAKAQDDGGSEFDMVMQVGRFLSGDYAYVSRDIELLAKKAHEGAHILKVINEAAKLLPTPGALETSCKIISDTGADFGKNATGCAEGPGATVEIIQVMRQALAPHVALKASKDIRTYDQAVALIHLGVTRLGTSGGIAIVAGAPSCGGCGTCSCS